METTIANVISNVGTFFTGSIGWLGEAVEVVANNPILFIMVVAMPVAGLKICESCLNRVNSVESPSGQYRAKLHSNVLKV